jgi:hypothetical protein
MGDQAYVKSLKGFVTLHIHKGWLAFDGGDQVRYRYAPLAAAAQVRCRARSGACLPEIASS